MYSYTWDPETGGPLLNSAPLGFSKEPRPVYGRELDLLGFGNYWNYAGDDSAPLLWAEANNYYYRGRHVARTKGGSLYTAPQLELIEEPEPDGAPLRPVDIAEMTRRNRPLLEKLAAETIRKIYNTYVAYRNRIDVFYVAFSGGKDSAVVLDLVQRALPHNEFKVLFGDTGMEFPDTYEAISRVEGYCKKNDIEFLRAKSRFLPEETWKSFGPPASTIRWCCSVHKTSPQIMLLQEKTGKQSFTGMAFTGIRGDESASRSEYEELSFGGKHRGQFSFHPILEWNSAELYLYIYLQNLILNNAYRKGNSRVGCLVCPMSTGRHEYMKRICYTREVDQYLHLIKITSGKTNFSDGKMTSFIDGGHWKTRKTGRELNFGYDEHIVETTNGKTTITSLRKNDDWQEWAKTIGFVTKINDDLFIIQFQGKSYEVCAKATDTRIVFEFPNCATSKEDIKFIALFKGVVVKSIYCVKCGVCAANCSHGCIDMRGTLKISSDCIHCYHCHDIYGHCLRYNSIRNNLKGVETKMKGIDRYFSFGVKKEWLESFFKERGSANFWLTDGHGLVPNKKKDAFLNFIKDAGMLSSAPLNGSDKYTKNIPTPFAEKLFDLGIDSISTWGLILCNLTYTPEFEWFIKNIPGNEEITPDRMKYMLDEIMEYDAKGLGKRNVISAFKMILIKTPIGAILGLRQGDYTGKILASGQENLTLKSFSRRPWASPDPRVILYSLYKFAEACGGYWQFTLTRLLNHGIESDGVSPTQIFGLDRDTMEKLLTGLSINYPEFINASFTLGLDTISLNAEKSSQDVLSLF